MEEKTAKELLDLLNTQDECDWVEAKKAHETSHSVMETVCAFANEPGLGGGYLLLGVEEERELFETRYKASSIPDPEKLQNDIATQCSSMFNIPVRPKLSVEEIDGETVIKMRVRELSESQKPLYFRSEGLPRGAFRRIGATDQRCTEDDMHIFYHDNPSYDKSPTDAKIETSIDESALKRYRTLRENVNPAAEELAYDDQELLEALGCVNKEDSTRLNLAGLLLFGSSKALRQLYPMLRVDYIRVPGNTWVEDPDERFSSVDMRGPLLLMVYRIIEAITADLPKGFLLEEGDIQAKSTGIPYKALREAIVNAVMHRSYREHRPTQVIRYDNRIEIINPGYSLKAEDKLGEPGSETRNPMIAAVFHETQLAETKGSGIRAMRRLMEQSHLAPPTFFSNRNDNEFTSRLLLHHFLDEKDLEWLNNFSDVELNDNQKQALVFIREVGAIDNRTYRQMADCDIAKASQDLRQLTSWDFLDSKGKGRATYYKPGERLMTPAPGLNTPPGGLNTPAGGLNTPAPGLNTPASPSKEDANIEIPTELQQKIDALGQRENDPQKLKAVIRELCGLATMSSTQIAGILGRKENHLKRKYLTEMIKSGELEYQHPDMINHPDQAYKSKYNDPQ